MRKWETNQSGFGAVEIVLVGLVVAIIAVGGVVLYQHHKKSPNTKSSAATSQTQTTTQAHNTATQSTQTNLYQGWNTYTSSDGNFTFRYPIDWYVAGGGIGPSAGEISLEPQSSQTSNTNAFRMTLWVTHDPDYQANPSSAQDGTVQQLSNGVDLWQENEAGAAATAPVAGVCPTLQIINQDQSHFSYQLKNGEFLSVHASYCEGQKDTVSLTYQQQITSQAWHDALKIIASISFQ